MTNLTLKNSRTKLIFMLIGSLGFVVAGLFILWAGKTADRLAGWMSIVFFGACSLVFLRQLMDRRARLTINDEGIFDRTLGVGLIPWSEITGAHTRSIKNVDLICLELKNPEKWTQKLSPVGQALLSANKSLGFSELNLNLSSVKADVNDIHELVLKMIAIHSAKKD